MNERESLCQYNQRIYNNHTTPLLFIFIEDSTNFRRYDIIGRVKKSIKEVFSYSFLVFILRTQDHKDIYKVDTCSPKAGCFRIILSKELIRKFLEGLGCKEAVLLTEKADMDYSAICMSRCFILGLHTDFDPERFDLPKHTAVGLGNVSYITSQCIYIIHLIKTLCNNML